MPVCQACAKISKAGAGFHLANWSQNQSNLRVRFVSILVGY